MSIVLADAGALVALLDRRERFHPWAVDQARTLAPPLIVCEPVLAEVCFLLAELEGGLAAIKANLVGGVWKLGFSLGNEWRRVVSLMETYDDQPMSLADGCLVRMAELNPDSRVFTLDRHFRIYRRNRRQVIPLVIPPEI